MVIEIMVSLTKYFFFGLPTEVAPFCRASITSDMVASLIFHAKKTASWAGPALGDFYGHVKCSFFILEFLANINVVKLGVSRLFFFVRVEAILFRDINFIFADHAVGLFAAYFLAEEDGWIVLFVPNLVVSALFASLNDVVVCAFIQERVEDVEVKLSFTHERLYTVSIKFIGAVEAFDGNCCFRLCKYGF